ncbi:MAG: hypothetical protein E6G94_06315 [Alphaproteobacteria bacterium]|nr:MAG: hypothetical protein E6G94_06315 [Alphaproteobacteria bacterium]
MADVNENHQIANDKQQAPTVDLQQSQSPEAEMDRQIEELIARVVGGDADAADLAILHVLSAGRARKLKFQGRTAGDATAERRRYG